LNPKTKAADLFEWILISPEVIEELVSEVIGAHGNPEALAMLLVPLRDSFKRGNPTGGLWTINYIMECAYRNSLQHFEAEEKFQKNIEKALETRLERAEKRKGRKDE
jgi:hypothetical protein